MSETGYIVFEGSGSSPINDGAYERWFHTYEEAIQSAIKNVKNDAKKYRWTEGWYAQVIVYEAPESTLHETHTIPCGQVVFRWENH